MVEAGLLKVIDVGVGTPIPRIVVPPGIFGPVIVLPTASPATLVTVAVAERAVVVVGTRPDMVGGTVAGNQLPLGTWVVAPIAVPVHCPTAFAGTSKPRTTAPRAMRCVDDRKRSKILWAAERV